MSQNEPLTRAQKVLRYYLKRATTGETKLWDSDNDAEAEAICEDLVDAVLFHIESIYGDMLRKAEAIVEAEERADLANKELAIWREKMILKYGPDRFEDMIDEARDTLDEWRGNR